MTQPIFPHRPPTNSTSPSATDISCSPSASNSYRTIYRPFGSGAVTVVPEETDDEFAATESDGHFAASSEASDRPSSETWLSIDRR
ncbi:hypothetical protein NliqN6_1369 [Naganishia liquefaciens]|uniref:Uncharacterized protein n=1 Tax=Naganishia liquefaciens TaxID=104408 RepID=A0A8H3TPS2_9TREE|nr:hypothetical protein NliqN6_1369 [Naganishia liquefaciens]